MKSHLKTTASVLVALVVGGCFAANGTPQSDQMSCSSPGVIDTVRFLIFESHGLDSSITNVGYSGSYGSQLVCSGEVATDRTRNVVITYFVQPLENGKVRVTGDSRPDIYFQIGPVDYLSEKKKLFEKQNEAQRIYEERLMMASSVLKNERNARLCAQGGAENPGPAHLMGKRGESFDECVERMLKIEGEDLDRKKVIAQKWANCVAEAKKKGIPDYKLQPNSGHSEYSNLVDCVGNYDPRLR